MPKVKYKDITFSEERIAMVQQSVDIVQEFRRQGYNLTLRQLYYQFVSKDWLPASWADSETGSTNNDRSYKKLGDIVADARLAGLIDWTAIEDRTREVDGNSHWETPKDIVEVCSNQFQLDKWDGQEYRVEVWVEKDALEGVVGKAAKGLDIQFFSCRGYASMTSIWDAGQRLKRYAEQGQTPVILHLGDHDPSGIDMSRDIQDRVRLFMDEYGDKLKFERIALNMPQIRQYRPPHNPAKVTDSRYKKYSDEHGQQSWELDALNPSVIERLIRNKVLGYRDEQRYQEKVDAEEGHKSDLRKAAHYWNGDLKEFLDEKADPAA